MTAPLPWSPRPHPGESMSGWVGRVASRYDIRADELCAHLLGQKTVDGGRVKQLDHRADPEMVGLLAAAARVAPNRLRAMRAAVDDTTASCWFRMDAAWCPECVRGDLGQGPEIHERAVWRIGCFVICPDHGVPLQGACGRCWNRPRCRFRPAQGWLGLACDICGELPYRQDQPTGGLEFGGTGAFNVQITPNLVVLVGELQRDLHAALLGATPIGPWGSVRSGPILLRVVRDFAFSIVLAKNVKINQRTQVVTGKGRAPYVTVLYEPVTPAALPVSAAFGVLAIAGTVLASMVPNSGTRQMLRQDRGLLPINTQLFLEWLGDEAQKWLCSSAGHWGYPMNAAFGAASTGTSSAGSTA